MDFFINDETDLDEHSIEELERQVKFLHKDGNWLNDVANAFLLDLANFTN